MKGKHTGQISGFTLIEILLAIFIFSIVMVTVFGSFNAVFSNVEAVQEHLQAYENAQTCFARIISDLSVIHITGSLVYKPPEATKASAAEDPYRVVCEKDDSADRGGHYKLRFASFSHLPFSGRLPGGVGEIIYYLDGKDGEKKILRRADNHVLEPPVEITGNDPILCKNVKSAQFIFYDQDLTEHENWNSDEEEFGYATPTAIRIILEIESGTAVHVFQTTLALPVRRLKKEGVL